MISREHVFPHEALVVMMTVPAMIVWAAVMMFTAHETLSSLNACCAACDTSSTANNL
jgi:hypothetical protein